MQDKGGNWSRADGSCNCCLWSTMIYTAIFLNHDLVINLQFVIRAKLVFVVFGQLLKYMVEGLQTMRVHLHCFHNPIHCECCSFSNYLIPFCQMLWLTVFNVFLRVVIIIMITNINLIIIMITIRDGCERHWGVGLSNLLCVSFPAGRPQAFPSIIITILGIIKAIKFRGLGVP